MRSGHECAEQPIKVEILGEMMSKALLSLYISFGKRKKT